MPVHVNIRKFQPNRLQRFNAQPPSLNNTPATMAQPQATTTIAVMTITIEVPGFFSSLFLSLPYRTHNYIQLEYV
jgi:hypothetical protein